MELLKSFNYLKIEDSDIIIPEDHKNNVRKRIKASKADPSRLLNWDKVKDKFSV